MKIRTLGAIVALAGLFSIAAVQPPVSPTVAAVAGQKLDSGLGELPHYSQWVDKSGRNPMGRTVAGEKLDSGLGDLPHYSKWLDKSGRDPMGRESLAVAGKR